MSAPVLWITNFATVKLHPTLPIQYRTGKVFAIMLYPRLFEIERSWGRVEISAPSEIQGPLLRQALEDRKRGSLFAEPKESAAGVLRKQLEARWEHALSDGMLSPGSLSAQCWSDRQSPPRMILNDGCILCCSCAVGAECHRRWLAPFLKRAGWDVRLEGLPLNIEV